MKTNLMKMKRLESSWKRNLTTSTRIRYYKTRRIENYMLEKSGFKKLWKLIWDIDVHISFIECLVYNQSVSALLAIGVRGGRGGRGGEVK